jgi:hypothetical protein
VFAGSPTRRTVGAETFRESLFEAGAGVDVTLGGVALLVEVHAASKIAATRWRIRDPTPISRDLFHDVTHIAKGSRRNRCCPPDLVMALCRRRHHRVTPPFQAVGNVEVVEELNVELC